MTHYSDLRNQQTPDYTGLGAIAADIIAKEEGFRPAAYHCSEGFPTIGYGQKIGERYQPLNVYQFTIPETVARVWLIENIASLLKRFDDHSLIAAAFVKCDLNRQAILISMAYQLGVRGLGNFKNMLTALINEDYEETYKQTLDSKWAAQTQGRAQRHAHTLLTGVLT